MEKTLFFHRDEEVVIADSKYDSVVFDMFGVICSEVAPYWLREYLPNNDADRVKRDVVGPADDGSVTWDELLLQLESVVGVSPEKIEQEWWSYVEIDNEVINIIKQLRGVCKVGLLTNAPSPFVRRILDEFDLSHLFDAIVVSSEHHIAKPDRRIYQVMLSALSSDANNAIMIDDNPANVDGAIGAGMHGITYVTADNLIRDLRVL